MFTKQLTELGKIAKQYANQQQDDVNWN